MKTGSEFPLLHVRSKMHYKARSSKIPTRTEITQGP